MQISGGFSATEKTSESDDPEAKIESDEVEARNHFFVTVMVPFVSKFF